MTRRQMMSIRQILCFLSALLAACSGDSLPRDLHLREAVAAKRYATGKPAAAGLWFAKPPEPLDITFEGERRSTVLTAVDPWRWTGRIPEGAELHAGVQILPVAWDTITAFRAWVAIRSGEESEVLDVVATRERQHPRWLDFSAGLSRWAGRKVTLEFAAFMEGLPAPYRHANLVAWSPVRISVLEEDHDGEERPNVLFILVDTLRADHLNPYGYRRDTSPNMARLLAQPGAVVEEAYSQAPWTLPSVVSVLTGRYPGELLGDNPTAYGVPEDVPSLPDTFRKLGYETGGFVANKTVHDGNGFGRGFLTFYSPPAETGPLDQPDAAAMTSRVLPWLAAHRSQPFFLYVHYLDPHDPYDNPEIVNGRSPYLPDYRGHITGRHVHGIWGGRVPLEHPRRDTEQLKALYDSEIHYVDRFIGKLLESIPPDVLANTLVVLTADHGEELYEHGGWKHGFTLYEEQIHVPLLVRWDGHIPAGTRLKGTVRLLDLAPTLVGAAGGQADPSWRGLDLMPALAGREPLPRRPAFAQHMMIGPLRAAAVLEKKKLFLFNPRTPYTPSDPLQAHLWSLDLKRLHRVELYDLARDPGERSNLVGRLVGGLAGRKDGEDGLARLQPVIHQQLDRQLPGLRVIASGLPAGARLQGSLALDRPPHRWVSYFLAEDDRIDMAGNRVTFDLGGETLEKGFLLEGDFGSIQALEARLDGRPLPAGGVLMGRGLPWAGSPVLRNALTAVAPAVPPGAALRVWLPGARRAAAAAPDPETEQRLRALGYIQ